MEGRIDKALNWPVWLRMWTLSVPLLANFCPQYGQIFSFSPVCVWQEKWWNRHMVDVKKNICTVHPHILPTLQSKMWSTVIAGVQRREHHTYQRRIGGLSKVENVTLYNVSSNHSYEHYLIWFFSLCLVKATLIPFFFFRANCLGKELTKCSFLL